LLLSIHELERLGHRDIILSFACLGHQVLLARQGFV
jgi:hypothetical protein